MQLLSAAGSRSACRLTTSVALTALLTGCTADLGTRIEVTGGQSSALSVALTMTGEAAGAVRSSPSLLASISHAVSSRTHTPVAVDTSAGAVTFSAPVAYADLISSSDVLGISAATLSGGDHNVHLTVTLEPASGLPAAIRAAVAGQADSTVLATTYLAAMTQTVTVRFPGGIGHVSGPPGTNVAGDTVVLRRPITSAAAVLRVDGDPHRPPSWPWWAAGAALLAGAAVGVRAALRRRAAGRPEAQ